MMLPPLVLLTGLLAAGDPDELDHNSFLCLKVCESDGQAHCRRVPYEPHEGDIILCKTNSLATRTIFRLIGAGPPTHCGIVVRKPDGCLGMLEAPQRGVATRIAELPWRLQTYDGKVWVRRICQPLTPEQSCRLTEWACAQEGKPFSSAGAALLVLLKGRKGPLYRLACPAPELEPCKWFCSQIVVAAGIVIGRLDPDKICVRGTDPRDLALDRQIDISRCWKKPVSWTCDPVTVCDK